MIPYTLIRQILNGLQLDNQPPTVAFLDQILHSYTRRIPWESASRNVRRVEKKNVYEECPRWPEEFWSLALAQGSGGTCFETNLALYALLSNLGYDGYLTINNMGQKLGCHTAIVLRIDGEKWLFDAGYPLECVLPLHPTDQSAKAANFLTYHTVPTENGTYQVLRSRHPKPYIFTLYDTPISLEDYKLAAANDYRPEGNFNASVVINKIVNEKMMRFSTWQDDVMFEAFTADPAGGSAGRETFEISENLPAQLATMFGIPEPILREALSLVST